MRNVEMKVDGSRLTIVVNLNDDVGMSKTGKSIVIATTEGNATVKGPAGDIKVGLNVYRPRTA